MSKAEKGATTSNQKGQSGSGAELNCMEKFTPDMSREIAKVIYRFKCHRAGSFLCTRTGLVFVVDGEVELNYTLVQWNDDLLRSSGSMAAGPLVRIECSEKVLRQVHLMHCEADPAKTPPRVARVNDDGMSFIKPLKITESYVIINYNGPSQYGLVGTIRQFFKAVTIQVHMFLSTMITRSGRKSFFLVMLPRNVPMDQMKTLHEKSKFAMNLPQCTLFNHHKYSVTCPDAHLVQPKDHELDLDFGPNFHPMFDVGIEKNTKQVTVTIHDKDKKKMVWEHTVNVPDHYPAPSTDKLTSERMFFVDYVTEPVLSNLMEKLVEKGFMSPIEMEWAQTRSREEKAGQVIDSVRFRGVEACTALIEILCELDPAVADNCFLLPLPEND